MKASSNKTFRNRQIFNLFCFLPAGRRVGSQGEETGNVKKEEKKSKADCAVRKYVCLFYTNLKERSKEYTSSHPIPYARGFIFILIKRYVYPSQAQASLTFVTVPNATSAFRLSFNEVMNCHLKYRELRMNSIININNI